MMKTLKQIISLVLVNCVLVVSCFVTVNAEIIQNQYISNINVLETSEDELKMAFTYYSSEDNRTYLVKSYENYIELYDYQTNELITRNEKETEIMHQSTLNTSSSYDFLPLASPDDYESWGAYSYYKKDTLHIGDYTGITVSILVGMIEGTFGTIVGVATELAKKAYNDKYSGLDANIYISANVYCPILIKQRYEYYPEGNSSTILNVEYRTPTFWGSPIDFSQPYACRVLDERY